LKQKQEDQDKELHSALDEKENEHTIFVKSLRAEIKSLEMHLTEEKQTGDVKNKVLEQELS
jgi:hypothetical protein